MVQRVQTKTAILLINILILHFIFCTIRLTGLCYDWQLLEKVNGIQQLSLNRKKLSHYKKYAYVAIVYIFTMYNFLFSFPHTMKTRIGGAGLSLHFVCYTQYRRPIAKRLPSLYLCLEQERNLILLLGVLHRLYN